MQVRQGEKRFPNRVSKHLETGGVWELQGKGSFGICGWGKLCALPARRDVGLWDGTVWTHAASPASPCTSSVFALLLLDTEPHPDAYQGCDAERLDLAALGSGHLATVHRIARQR